MAVATETIATLDRSGGIPTLGSRIRVQGADVVKQRLIEVPGRANRAINQGLVRISRSFYRRFHAERLSGPPGITVHRVGKSRTKMGVPGKARLLGFYSRIFPLRKLPGKTLKMGSGWPELWIHETGGVVRAKGGGWLYLRNKPRSGAIGPEGDIVGRVKSVQIEPRLEFIDTFEQNTSEYRQLLDEAWQKVADKV